MNTKISAATLHKNVPPNWYHESIKINYLQRFWHWRRRVHLQTFTVPNTRTVLDVGCADGVFTNVIAERSGAEKVIGIDVLESSIEWAKDHWKNNTQLNFMVGDAHALDFEDNTFDAAYCIEAMEHLENPRLALEEIRRVLQPGGRAVLMVPTDNLLFRIIWAIWTKFRGKIWHETHLQSFRKKSLGTFAESCGFSIVKEKRFLLGMLYIVQLQAT